MKNKIEKWLVYATIIFVAAALIGIIWDALEVVRALGTAIIISAATLVIYWIKEDLKYEKDN